MDNKYYPYNGGNIEEVPAGETDGIRRAAVLNPN